MEERHKSAELYFSNLYTCLFSCHLFFSGALQLFVSRHNSHRDQTQKHQQTPLDCLSINEECYTVKECRAI